MPNLSYAQGQGGKPLIDLNMGQFIHTQVSKYADRVALCSSTQSKRLTYQELGNSIEIASRALLALGISKSDRVGLWSSNRIEWVVLQYAVAKIGAILVHINPAYKEDELEYTLKHSGCRALFLSPYFRRFDCLECSLNVKSRTPELKWLVSLDSHTDSSIMNWDSFLALSDRITDAELLIGSAEINPSSPASIQYTSGTTGKPKGATLTQFNMLNNANQVGHRLGLEVSDVICLPVPMFHCAGSVVGVMAALSHGASVVMMGEGFDPVDCINVIERYSCTAVIGVPMMYIGILNAPNFHEQKMRSLKKGTMGASSCPPELFKAAIEQMHLTGLCSSYGMTETSPMSTQSNANDPIEIRTQTVGFVHPHIEIKIVDPISGETVEKGQSGELCVRGYSVMQGYWQDPEATAQAIDNEGWMHSGDLALMRDDGYVCIVGRMKDMVIRAGENIYPKEIEDFLHQLPDIADAHVFGVPDPIYGEQLAAWVKLKPGSHVDEASLRARCKGKMASFKIPHYWRFVEDYPSTSSGKVQKFKMRQFMIEELNLKDS